METSSKECQSSTLGVTARLVETKNRHQDKNNQECLWVCTSLYHSPELWICHSAAQSGGAPHLGWCWWCLPWFLCSDREMRKQSVVMILYENRGTTWLADFIASNKVLQRDLRAPTFSYSKIITKYNWRTQTATDMIVCWNTCICCMYSSLAGRFPMSKVVEGNDAILD